jgi:DHA1 family tetracycline resistance protein-like MFS transporter
MLMTMMTKNVPENAQGELQGGVAALLNVSQLAGTVFFSQMFGYFMGPNAPFQSPSMGFFIAAGGLVMTMGLFLALVRRPTA